MDAFVSVVNALLQDGVRFVVSGVWGANYYASGTLFVTQDQDLFLPESPQNLLAAWDTLSRLHLELIANGQPLDRPRDLELAIAVVRTRALSSATDGAFLHVDLSLLMSGLSFEEVWLRRRTFVADHVSIPVASLVDIVAAKHAANRPKDRLFLATHAAELQRMLVEHKPSDPPATE